MAYGMDISQQFSLSSDQVFRVGAKSSEAKENTQKPIVPQVKGQGRHFEQKSVVERAVVKNFVPDAPSPPPPPPSVSFGENSPSSVVSKQQKKSFGDENVDSFLEQLKEIHKGENFNPIAFLNNNKTTKCPVKKSPEKKPSESQTPIPDKKTTATTHTTARDLNGVETVKAGPLNIKITKTYTRASPSPLSQKEIFEKMFADDEPVIIHPESLPEATAQSMYEWGIRDINQETFDKYTMDMFCSTELGHYTNRLTTQLRGDISRVEDASFRHFGLTSLYKMVKDDMQSIRLLRLIAKDDDGDFPEDVIKEMFKGIAKETSNGKVKLPKGIVEVVAEYDPNVLPKELFKGIRIGEKYQNEKLAQAIVQMVASGDIDRLPEDMIKKMARSSGQAFSPQLVLRERNFRPLEMHMRKDETGVIEQVIDPSNAKKLKSLLKIINNPNIRNLILSGSDQDLAGSSELRKRWRSKLREEIKRIRKDDIAILEQAEKNKELEGLLDAAEKDYRSKSSESSKEPSWSASSGKSISDRIMAFQYEKMKGFNPLTLISDYYKIKANQLIDMAKEKGDDHPVKSACWQLRDEYGLLSSASDFRKNNDGVLQKNLEELIASTVGGGALDEASLITVDTLREYRKYMAGEYSSDEVAALIDYAAAEALDKRIQRDGGEFNDSERQAWLGIKKKIQNKKK